MAAKPTETLNLAGSNYCRLNGGGGVSPLWSTLDSGVGLAYQTLLWNNGPGKPFTPQLATSWQIADGNKSITFTLRPNVKFSDGTPLDAQAVKTWIDYRAKAPEAQYGLGYMGAIQSVDVVSANVVRISLVAPNPSLEYAFSQSGYNWGDIASPQAVAQAQATANSPVWNQGTYGAGPYMLDATNSVVGDHCTYVPNPNYYDQSKVKWAKVVTRPLADANAILAAMQSGQVDIAQTATASVAGAAKSAGLTTLFTKSIAVGMVLIDHGGLNPALADVGVRQALNYAVDRKAITDALYPNSGTPTSDPDPALGGTDGYDAASYNYYSYDPAKAKSLLSTAGYANGFTIKVLTAQGGFGFAADQMAQSVCKYWAAVGVKCDLNNVAASAFNNERFTSKAYSAVSNVEATPPTWVWFNNYMLPSGYGSDQHGWTDQTSTDLWQKASQLSTADAATYWKQIHTRYIEQAFSVPIASPGALWMASNRVSGVALNGAGNSNVLDWSPSGK